MGVAKKMTVKFWIARAERVILRKASSIEDYQSWQGMYGATHSYWQFIMAGSEGLQWKSVWRRTLTLPTKWHYQIWYREACVIGGWLFLIYGWVKKFGTMAWWCEKEERRVGLAVLAVLGRPVCLYRTFCLVHKLTRVNLLFTIPNPDWNSVSISWSKSVSVYWFLLKIKLQWPQDPGKICLQTRNI